VSLPRPRVFTVVVEADAGREEPKVANERLLLKPRDLDVVIFGGGEGGSSGASHGAITVLSSPVVGTFAGRASGDKYFHVSDGSRLISVDILGHAAWASEARESGAGTVCSEQSCRSRILLHHSLSPTATATV